LGCNDTTIHGTEAGSMSLVLNKGMAELLAMLYSKKLQKNRHPKLMADYIALFPHTPLGRSRQ